MGLWAALLFYVRPFGNFPLNDDWAYSWSVRHLLETGSLRILDWSSPSLIFHVLWGALFCLAFGLSHAVLRISVWVLGLLGVLVFRRLSRNLGLDQKESFWAALLLMLNPLWLLFSFSFHTEITYSFLTLLAVYFFCRERFWTASLFSSLAFLTRQTGILLTAFMALLKPKKAVFLMILPLFSLLIYLLWFYLVHGPTLSSQKYLLGAHGRWLASLEFIRPFFLRFLQSGATLGFFIFPLLFSTEKKKFFFPVMAALAFVFFMGPMPYLGNSLHAHGLGTLTLSFGEERPSGFFHFFWFWPLCGFLGAAGFFWLIQNMKIAAGQEWLTILLPQWIFPLLFVRYFDRYLIPFLPAVVLFGMLSLKGRPYSLWKLLFGIILLGLFSSAGLKDYFQWNRAKWELGKKALEAGYRPEQIDNGFDWLGEFTYERNMMVLKTQKPLNEIKEWDWAHMNPRDTFTSFSEKWKDKGFGKIAEISYDTPLSARKGWIFLWGKK